MRPPIALTIAGSDPSGGAGIQADLKTFTALGTYGCAILTSLTAQNTQGVDAVFTPPASFVREQLTTLLDDVYVDATKIGMIPNAEVAEVIADVIEERRSDFGKIVLDPVMVATSGDMLMEEDAMEILRDRLLPLADVLTPNIPEAALLLGEDPATDEEEMKEQGLKLINRGPKSVLVKGGHLRGSALVDVFVQLGNVVDVLTGEMINTRNTHGTGCTLSSAIAAQYARVAGGADATDIGVVASAREFLQSAILHAKEWEISKSPESGHGPTNHLITVQGV